MINPFGSYDALPGNVYFQLWDNFNGVVTISDSALAGCKLNSATYTDGYLVKYSNNATVYLHYYTYFYPVTYNGFVKYGFSWGKIRVAAPGQIWPVASSTWE
jgi:hypothetical protein